MNGAVFDVGRVSRFQRGLLTEDSLQLLCTEITRGESSCNLDEGKSFSVPMWFSTSRLVPDCFAQMLQEKKV